MWTTGTSALRGMTSRECTRGLPGQAGSDPARQWPGLIEERPDPAVVEPAVDQQSLVVDAFGQQQRVEPGGDGTGHVGRPDVADHQHPRRRPPEAVDRRSAARRGGKGGFRKGRSRGWLYL